MCCSFFLETVFGRLRGEDAVLAELYVYGILLLEDCGSGLCGLLGLVFIGWFCLGRRDFMVRMVTPYWQ